MGTRELIILILGLAVVAVMLRGLYLALQARRGQLRLAIDKNIPKDVDLNALEMAELPNGGARVVGQSLERVNRQNRRAEKAAALDLGGSAAKVGAIPVLMDTVELGEARIHAIPPRAELDDDDEFEDDFEDDLDDEDLEDEFDDDEDFDEDLDKDVVEIEEEEDLDEFEEEDDFEDEDDDLDKEELDDEEEDFDPDSDEEDEDEFEENEEEEDEDFLDQPGADELVDDDDEYTVNVAGRSEPVIQDRGETDGEFEKEFGSISMTAGERIGAKPLSPTPPIEAKFKTSARAEQASLFNDDDQPEPAPKRASLLERFGERARSRSAKSEHAEKAPKMQKRKEARPAPTQDVRSVREAREQKEVRPIEPSEVLVINVMAREGEVFHGDDLLQALITTGLKFGEMNIFHHRLQNASNGPVIFSVANILNPGTFDLNRMGEFNTRGISMFLSMPAVISNLEAFELMLKTAQQIRGAMNGELKDDHRNVMTAQTIEHYRQRVRDYELRRLKAAQA